MKNRLTEFFSFFSQSRRDSRQAEAVLAKCQDPAIRTLISDLPAIATRFCEAASAIYHKVLLEQFHDYEERYGAGLLARINSAREARLIRAIQNYMLYAVFRYVNTESSNDIARELTLRLQQRMEQRSTGSPAGARHAVPLHPFMDYINYQNPNFEDAAMAPAFLFGNNIGEIMEQFDRPFSFMASQQAMMIGKITEALLPITGARGFLTPHNLRLRCASKPSFDLPSSVGICRGTARRAPGVAFATLGWWFVWGIFSAIMVLIVLRGGGLRFSTQIFVIVGVGVLAGTTAVFCRVRKRFRFNGISPPADPRSASSGETSDTVSKDLS